MRKAVGNYCLIKLSQTEGMPTALGPDIPILSYRSLYKSNYGMF